MKENLKEANEILGIKDDMAVSHISYKRCLPSSTSKCKTPRGNQNNKSNNEHDLHNK